MTGRELIVDRFAGGGGASTGIELALASMGVTTGVDIAINHSGGALAMHAANHPDTSRGLKELDLVKPDTTFLGVCQTGLWFEYPLECQVWLD